MAQPPGASPAAACARSGGGHAPETPRQGAGAPARHRAAGGGRRPTRCMPRPLRAPGCSTSPASRAVHPRPRAATREAGSAESIGPLALWVASSAIAGASSCMPGSAPSRAAPVSQGAAGASRVWRRCGRMPEIKRHGDAVRDGSRPSPTRWRRRWPWWTTWYGASHDVDGVRIDDLLLPLPDQRPRRAAPKLPERARPRTIRPWLALPVVGRHAGSEARWRRRRSVIGWCRRLHRTVHQGAPWVRFGYQPVRLQAKPALRPPAIDGFSQYDKLYADAETLAAAGRLADYLAPQPVLVRWTARPGPASLLAARLLAGSWNPHAGAMRAGARSPAMVAAAAMPRRRKRPPPAKAGRRAAVPRQIEHSRARLPRGGGGHLHRFSMVALMQDRDGIAEALPHRAVCQFRSAECRQPRPGWPV